MAGFSRGTKNGSGQVEPDFKRAGAQGLDSFHGFRQAALRFGGQLFIIFSSSIVLGSR
jgi:hypothetical protein